MVLAGFALLKARGCRHSGQARLREQSQNPISFFTKSDSGFGFAAPE
jgi:hypothetical protein